MAGGIMIAGTSSGAGKTTISLGLMRALSKQHKIVPFKVGPDYIDAAYHRWACGNFSYNLDIHMLGQDNVRRLYQQKAGQGDIAVIEGVMGLYDGMDDTACGSSAHVAKLLGVPVILVMDAGAMAASASAMVMGYRDYDRQLDLAGVILNKVGNPKHYELLRRCIERDTAIPVLGYIPDDPALALPERHLGLVPAFEMSELDDRLNRLSRHIEACIDLDALVKIADRGCSRQYDSIQFQAVFEPSVKIAIAWDEAFNFYYKAGLELFQKMGAQLVPISFLHDKRLPDDIGGLYIGGGFPEMFAQRLSQNQSMLRSVKDDIKNGLPVYAECGGLMYLCRAITDLEGKRFPMADIYDAEAMMTKGLEHFGYVQADVTADNVLTKAGCMLCGHEFHHSKLIGALDNACYAVKRPNRDEIWLCGYAYKNCLATYVHIDFFAYPELVQNFISQCSEFRR